MNVRLVARLAGVALALMLTGCSHLATTPAPPPYVAEPAAQHYEGRLAVRVENDPKRSFSANFTLDGQAQSGQLSLSTAIGTQVALARWLPGRVWLVDGDGTREFEALDQLSRETLGEDIPLVAFFDWLGGRPWPEAPSQPLQHNAPGFEQMGWHVRLDRFNDGLIVAQRQTPSIVNLRVKLDAASAAATLSP